MTRSKTGVMMKVQRTKDDITVEEEVEIELRESGGEVWLCFCWGYESLPLKAVLEVLEENRRPWAANFGGNRMGEILVYPDALCEGLAELLVAT